MPRAKGRAHVRELRLQAMTDDQKKLLADLTAARDEDAQRQEGTPVEAVLDLFRLLAASDRQPLGGVENVARLAGRPLGGHERALKDQAVAEWEVRELLAENLKKRIRRLARSDESAWSALDDLIAEPPVEDKFQREDRDALTTEIANEIAKAVNQHLVLGKPRTVTKGPFFAK